MPTSLVIYPPSAEITILERSPPIVTTTCIGKARWGTAEAVKVLLSGLNLNQAGRAAPLTVVTRMATALSAAAAANWAGKEKLKLLPAATISLGTETVMMPNCCADGSRTSTTETPPPATREVPVVALLPTPEGAAAPPDVSEVGDEGDIPARDSPTSEPTVLLALAVGLLAVAAPVVVALPTPEGAAAPPDVSGAGDEGDMSPRVSPATEPAVLLTLVAVGMLALVLEPLGDRAPAAAIALLAVAAAAAVLTVAAAFAEAACVAATAAVSTAMVSVPLTKLLK